MRSNEERADAVKSRVRREEKRRALNRSRIAAAGSALASMAIILATALKMPELGLQMKPAGYAGYEMTASLFSSSAAGHIAVGLLAFILGVCVTILGLRVRRLQGEQEKTEEQNVRADR